MEIRFYTPELNLIGIMENQTSLLWTRKYYEPGNFQLITPITDYNLFLCKRGNIIHFEGAVEAAVIECVVYRQEHSRRIITCVGRMLSSYFDRRLIRPYALQDDPVLTFSGRVEQIMRELVDRLDFPIPLVQLGEYHGYGDEITITATYKNLLVYLERLSQTGNIGFRLVPDFTNKTLTFETYVGVNRAETQSERMRVMFSEELQNISTIKYQNDDRKLKNFFYINREGDYSFIGNMQLEGLERRELLLSENKDDQLIYNPPVFDQPYPERRRIPIFETDYDDPIYSKSVDVVRDSNGSLYVSRQDGLYDTASSDTPVYKKVDSSGSSSGGATRAEKDFWSSYKEQSDYIQTYVGREPKSTSAGLYKNTSTGEYVSGLDDLSKYSTYHKYIRIDREGRPYQSYMEFGSNLKTIDGKSVSYGLEKIGRVPDTSSSVLGYGRRRVGWRDETDAELETRVSNWEKNKEQFQVDLEEYEKEYAKRLEDYAFTEDNLYKNHSVVLSYEMVVDPFGNFKYKKDYDLGDIVSFAKETWSIVGELRIVEAQEIYEHGIMMVELVLGNPMHSKIDWEEK